MRQQALDVVQLHKCLLEGVLGISEEAIRDQNNVRYIRDIERGDGTGAQRRCQCAHF